MYFAALLISGPAVYSGKYFSSATCNGAKTRSQDGTNSGEAQTTHLGQFTFEDVDLVEEEDDRRAEEPPRVNNALKEDK
jgi:hypothetical protein